MDTCIIFCRLVFRGKEKAEGKSVFLWGSNGVITSLYLNVILMEGFSVADPVKAARPGGPTSGPRGPHVGHGGSGPGQQHPVPHAEQLRRLEAEVAARAAEVKAARAERDQAGRGVEALSVIIHHLTHTVSTGAGRAKPSPLFRSFLHFWSITGRAPGGLPG